MQKKTQKAVAHAARAPQLFELHFTKKTLKALLRNAFKVFLGLSALRCKN